MSVSFIFTCLKYLSRKIPIIAQHNRRFDSFNGRDVIDEVHIIFFNADFVGDFKIIAGHNEFGFERMLFGMS